MEECGKLGGQSGADTLLNVFENCAWLDRLGEVSRETGTLRSCVVPRNNLRSKCENRYIRQFRVLPDLLRGLPSIQYGEPQVHHDQVREVLAGLCDSLGTITSLYNLVPSELEEL